MDNEAVKARRAAVKARLVKAKALIADPAHWGQHVFRTEDRYCALGAVMYAGSPRAGWPAGDIDLVASGATTALYRALPKRGEAGGVTEYNDDPTTTHADIMALYDRAIASIEEVAVD